MAADAYCGHPVPPAPSPVLSVPSSSRLHRPPVVSQHLRVGARAWLHETDRQRWRWRAIAAMHYWMAAVGAQAYRSARSLASADSARPLTDVAIAACVRIWPQHGETTERPAETAGLQSPVQPFGRRHTPPSVPDCYDVPDCRGTHGINERHLSVPEARAWRDVLNLRSTILGHHCTQLLNIALERIRSVLQDSDVVARFACDSACRHDLTPRTEAHIPRVPDEDIA